MVESVPGTMPKFEVGQVFVNPNGVECRITDIKDDVYGDTQVTYMLNDEPGTAYCGKSWSIENMLVKNSYVLQESSHKNKKLHEEYAPTLDENGKTPYYVGFIGFDKKDTEQNHPDLYVYDPERGEWGFIGYGWYDYMESVKKGEFDINNIWCECHERNPMKEDQDENWKETCARMEQAYPGMDVYMTILPKKDMDQYYKYGLEVPEEEVEDAIGPIFRKWAKLIYSQEPKKRSIWCNPLW